MLGNYLLVALIGTSFLAACDSPEADPKHQFEIRDKAIAILRKLGSEKADVRVGDIFEKTGIGICVSRGNPQLRQLEKGSNSELHQVIPLLEKFNDEHPSSNWDGYYRIYVVGKNEVFRAIEVSDGSAILAVGGEGCYRYTDTASIDGPAKIKTASVETTEKIGIEFFSKQIEQPAARK